MILLLTLIAAAIAALICFVTVVQTLYLEALRLRARDVEALQYFKESLQPKIGLKTEQGALAFSLVKHIALTLLGVVVLMATSWGAGHVWYGAVAALLIAPGTMFVSSYLAPQFLYRKTSGRWLAHWAPAIRGLAVAIRPLTGLLNFLYSLSELGEDEAGSDDAGSAEDNVTGQRIKVPDEQWSGTSVAPPSTISLIGPCDPSAGARVTCRRWPDKSRSPSGVPPSASECESHSRDAC